MSREQTREPGRRMGGDRVKTRLRSRLRATRSGSCGGSRSQVNRWFRAVDLGLSRRRESCDHGLTGVPELTPSVPGTMAPTACSS